MPDASPTKWHRAHTTWFFEAFVLEPAGVEVVDRRYGLLFNSYYEAKGPRHARAQRGLLSRPTADQVGEYRKVVDARVIALLERADATTLERVLPVLTLGIAHEEQHQELVLTDILHAFAQNPLRPSFLPPALRVAAMPPLSAEAPAPGEARFIAFEEGVHLVGADGSLPFAFDNERPRHKQWVRPFALADRLVTVAELKAFLDARGYDTPALWLSEGFDFVRANGIRSPLYSTYADGELRVFSLAGARVPAGDEPVAHVSYYEADALARFLGGRLPTEAEWEIAASRSAATGNFVEDGVYRPISIVSAGRQAGGVRQLFGDAWEWTRSSYEAYPGYEPPAGALGEYNGKFMVNQRVLRGGSCLTPARHVRASYRNFWHPHTQFQMTGLRLAREVAA
jgi:ergothioneine biosynthesis protein EgtB